MQVKKVNVVLRAISRQARINALKVSDSVVNSDRVEKSSLLTQKRARDRAGWMICVVLMGLESMHNQTLFLICDWS